MTFTILLTQKHFSWFAKLWTLSILSMLSFTHLFTPHYTFEQLNSVLSCDTMSSVLVSLTLWISLIIILARQTRVKINLNKPSLFSFFSYLTCPSSFNSFPYKKNNTLLLYIWGFSYPYINTGFRLRISAWATSSRDIYNNLYCSSFATFASYNCMN